MMRYSEILKYNIGYHLSFLLLVGLTCLVSSHSPTSHPINEKLVYQDSIKKGKSLRTDLEKYDGFYSSIESNDGRISPENLPEKVLAIKKTRVKSIDIDYLDKVRNGYLLVFTIDFTRQKILVVSTLNSEYELLDYRCFPNGNGSTNPMRDTISMTTFGINSVTVDLMHPNLTEEPSMEMNGIKQIKLTINHQLKLIT